MRVRPLPLLLLLALAAAIGLVVAQGRHQRDDRGAVLEALRRAHGPQLPEAARAGASSRSVPQRYDRETLYELIDGAAEAYLADGFESCVAASYAFAGLEVAAEAHRFSTPSGARSRFAAKRPQAAQPLAELPDAASDGTVLVAVAGRDLLELTSFASSRNGLEALRAITLAWHRESSP